MDELDKVNDALIAMHEKQLATANEIISIKNEIIANLKVQLVIKDSIIDALKTVLGLLNKEDLG